MQLVSVIVPPKLWRMFSPPPFAEMIEDVWFPVKEQLVKVTSCLSEKRLTPPPLGGSPASTVDSVRLFEIVQPEISTVPR